MSDWLKNLLADFTLAGTVTGGLIYLAKKVGDLIIDWLKPNGKPKKRSFLVSFQNFYGGELERHRQGYVQRMEVSGTGAVEQRGVVQKIEDWAKGPTHFLILSGEGAIGKSRCCIEAAKMGKMQWINVKGYKNKPQDLAAGLEGFVREKMVCVFEDYQEYRDLFPEVANLIIRKKAKLLVVSREEEGPKREIGNRETPEVIQLRKMADETLKEIAKEKVRLTGEAKLDDLTLLTIISISQGIPGIVILALEHYTEKKTLRGIKTYDQLLQSIFQNFEKSSGESWPVIKPLLGKMALLRGAPANLIKEHYEKLKAGMYAGQIVNSQDGNFRIQPDILNDYIAKQVYFEPFLSPDFEPTIEEFLQTKSREVLITLINCNNRKAVEILLRKARTLGAKTVVTLGIDTYEAFKDLDLVQSNLGEFWGRVWELTDPDDYHRTATLLSLLAKWDDAEKCWNRAVELCQAQNNQWGIGTIFNSLGSMSIQRNDWGRAIEFQEKALEAFGRVEGDLGVFGSAQTHNNIAIVFANQGEWAKAAEQSKQALETFSRLKGDYGVYGKAQTYLVSGNIAHRAGKRNQAIEFYDIARQGFEELKNVPGRAKTYTALSLVYADNGDWETANQFYQRAMGIMNLFGDLHSIAQIYRDFGSLYMKKGDWDNAEASYHDAHATSEQLGDSQGTANALIGFASIHQGRGNWDEAARYYETARHLFDTLGNANGIAQTELGLGSTYFAKADWERAAESYQRAMATFEQSGNRDGKALASLNLGAVCQRRGDYARAIELYEDALKTLELLGNQLGTANAYLNIGSVHQDKSEWDDALQFYQESLRISEEIGNGREILRADVSIGSIYQNRGDWDQAIKIYENALKYYEELDDLFGKADVRVDLGSVYNSKGEWEKALHLYEEALAISEKLQNKRGIARAQSGLADVHEKRGEWDLAIELYQKAFTASESFGDRLGMANTSRSIGWVFLRKGDTDQATQYCKKSLAISDEIGDEVGKAATFTNLGAIYAESDSYEEASHFYEKSLEISEKLESLPGLSANYNNLSNWKKVL